MNDPGKAVFLSYAREDSAAARRIADALRAFGVEVWDARCARSFGFRVWSFGLADGSSGRRGVT